MESLTAISVGAIPEETGAENSLTPIEECFTPTPQIIDSIWGACSPIWEIEVIFVILPRDVMRVSEARWKIKHYRDPRHYLVTAVRDMGPSEPSHPLKSRLLPAGQRCKKGRPGPREVAD